MVGRRFKLVRRKSGGWHIRLPFDYMVGTSDFESAGGAPTHFFLIRHDFRERNVKLKIALG